MGSNYATLLKKFLPGLLPILIFVLVDAFWSTEAGLVVALAFGVIQLLYTFVREKRLDRFVLFDTALLLLLGGVSLAFNNEVFFKLKPFVINLLMCGLLGFSAYGPKNLLLQYSSRYMQDVNISPEIEKAFIRQIRIFFWGMLAYSALTLYSALYMGREAWGFISGALLYVLLGIYFLWQYLNSRLRQRKTAPEEWLPLVDESGRVVGKATRQQVHSDASLLHPVVHLHVFDNAGRLYLQKRPDFKDIQPGKWDISVGGHMALGETVEQALRRECQEEIGLTHIQATPLFQYLWKTEVESELVFSFKTLVMETPRHNPDELADGRFFTREEILQKLGKDFFTPNFEHEAALLFPRKEMNTIKGN